MGGTELERLLGFTNNAAFRQALRRGRLPVRVFPLPDRRGKFAFTAEIAAWQKAIRESLVDQEAGPAISSAEIQRPQKNEATNPTDHEEGTP